MRRLAYFLRAFGVLSSVVVVGASQSKSSFKPYRGFHHVDK